VEAVIRRASGHANPTLRCGPIELEPVAARVKMNGVAVNITALEYRTLQYLMQKKDSIVSKSELSEHIYGQNLERDSNVIEVLINRLRSKLDPALIQTRRGLGYLIKEVGGET